MEQSQDNLDYQAQLITKLRAEICAARHRLDDHECNPRPYSKDMIDLLRASIADKEALLASIVGVR